MENLYDAHNVNDASGVNVESGARMEDSNNTNGSAAWKIAAQHFDDPVENAPLQKFVMTSTVGLCRLQKGPIESFRWNSVKRQLWFLSTHRTKP